MNLLLDNRWLRRIVTIPALIIATVVALAFAPLAFVIAIVVDLAARPTRTWNNLRRLLLIVGALVIEVLGLVGALGAWIVTGFGLAPQRRRGWRLHARLLGWYTRSMLALIVASLGTEVEWRGLDEIERGPYLLAARHTSFFDALLPGVLTTKHGLIPHHVLARGLMLGPCIDVVGHRMPNRFVARGSGAQAEDRSAIEQLAGHLDAESVGVIFPEGTFRAPQRFSRALARFSEKRPDLAPQVRGLEHVLPPRAGGLWALLAGSPEADVVVCANTGLEPFSTIAQIWNQPVAERPIIVECRRIDRAEVPDNHHDFEAWLLDRYVEIDDWVTQEIRLED